MVRISDSRLKFLGSFVFHGHSSGHGLLHAPVSEFNKVMSKLTASTTTSRFHDWIVDPGAQVIQGRDISGSSRHRKAVFRADVIRLRVHVQGIVPPALEP